MSLPINGIRSVALALTVAVAASSAVAGNSQESSGTAWLWLTTESAVDCAFTVKVDWAGYRRARYLEVFVTEGYDGEKLVPKRIKIRPGQTTATVTTNPLDKADTQTVIYPWAQLLNWRGDPIPSSLDFAGGNLAYCAAPQ